MMIQVSVLVQCKENVVCWFYSCEEDNNPELVYTTHVWKNILDPYPPANSDVWMCNGTSRWGQAFDHWRLAVFSFWYTWLYKGVTCFVFLLSFPLSLPFDWTLRYWVYVCCFVLLYFGCYVMLCVKKKNVDKKKVKKKKMGIISDSLMLLQGPCWVAYSMIKLI